MAHLDPSMLLVDTVPLSECVGEGKMIWTHSLAGGECRAGDRDGACERQRDGGTDRSVDGHGIREGGVHILMISSLCSRP